MINKIFMTKRLQLRLNTGLDEEMNPVFRVRSWSGVKSAVSDAVLHQLGTNIGTLCEHGLDRVQTQENHELCDL